MKRLLSVLFDLFALEHRKAMKEFGIANIGLVFTKLFDNGIKNFQDLLTTHTSVDEIEINGFDNRNKVVLNDMMGKNKISFDMYLPI